VHRKQEERDKDILKRKKVISESENEKYFRKTGVAEAVDGNNMLKLLVLTHIEFQIISNKSQRFIHAWWDTTF
jgi:hypothetical protein